jgi:uracil phosphoribosyltransferase
MKTVSQFPNLHIVDHPLVQDKLSRMRDKNTPMRDFRRLLKEIALLIGYEITRPIKLTQKTIETPIESMEAPVLEGKPPVIVPILRAGQGMAEGLIELMPDSAIGYIGLYRDEKTHYPVEYLKKLPRHEGQIWIVVDPMLATGHSSEYAFKLLLDHGVPRTHLRFMALVAAPEGVAVMNKAYPDIPIYVASLDKCLNENAFIVPGLGDAGDRLFGTH